MGLWTPGSGFESLHPSHYAPEAPSCGAPPVMNVKVGFGHDSHAFEEAPSAKPLVLGGVVIPDMPGLRGDSDSDVILHAIGRALDSVTGARVMGPLSGTLCRQGVTDSRVYVRKALEFLPPGARIAHVAVAVEGRTPVLEPWVDAIRAGIADLLGIPPRDVGITATSGDFLTAFGHGQGLQAWAVVTVVMEAGG